MSKGKFEPGKRVLLLGDSTTNEFMVQFVGTIQVLAFPAPRFGSWVLQEITSVDGRMVGWRQSRMILLDPDETPEQSAEAMRDLYSLPQKVTA